MEDHGACVCEMPVVNWTKLSWRINYLYMVAAFNLDGYYRQIISEPNCIGEGDQSGWTVTNLIFREAYGKSCLGFQIHNDKTPESATMQHKYCVNSDKGEQTYTKIVVGNTGREWDVFIDINDNFTSGNLEITCEVTTYGELDHNQQAKIEIPECNRENLGRLFESRELSDVTIVTSREEIRAHKAILAAESSVFLKMFESEMMEKKNRVEIIDVDPEVLMEMLRFIYTGKTTKLEETAFDLLAAAEKYNLQTLKIHCEAEICRNISIENSVDILIHADIHRAQNLKKMAIDFIAKHFKEVKEIEGFKTKVQSHPSLLYELLDSAMQ